MSLLGEDRNEAAPNPEHARAENLLRDAHAGKTVLVAEDNPVNQDVALTLLGLAGLKVDIASNGLEAVEMASTTAYPLILMDVQMPVLDGLQAARQLRAQPANAATPIIAMTANAHADDRDACLAAGMNDYLTKPVDAITLYRALSRWLTAPARTPVAAPAPAAPASTATPLPAATEALATDPLAGIEGLNAALGLAFLGGNRAAFRGTLLKLANLYAGGVPEAKAYLDGARPPTEATEGLRQALHSVGGASAAMGLEALSASASRLGAMLRDSSARSAALDDEVRSFDAMLNRVTAQIRERLA
jgi:CheY-like chemotaxis protein